MNKEQKEIIKRINQAYGKLRCLNNITWTSYREDLLEMNKKDEKRHRSGDWYNFHKNSASVTECSKMFVVSDIAESLLNPDKWQIKDLLHIKKSTIFAQSLVNNYGDKIKEAWKDEDIEYLSKLDYIALVNWENYKKFEEKRVA